jgi:hypothetical protein
MHQEITVELDFITQWMDMIIFMENKNMDSILHRDQKQIRSLDPIFLKQIWKPDIFIGTAVESFK